MMPHFHCFYMSVTPGKSPESHLLAAAASREPGKENWQKGLSVWALPPISAASLSCDLGLADLSLCASFHGCKIIIIIIGAEYSELP